MAYAALTQAEWQSIMDETRLALAQGSLIQGSAKVRLILRAVVDATAQLQATSNTAAVTAIAEDPVADGDGS